MRTTVTLEPDVAAEVDRLRRAEGIGVSAAINRLVRSAAAHTAAPEPYRHRSAGLGLLVDVSDIGAVLDLLDEA